MIHAKTLEPEVFSEDHPWWKEFVDCYEKRSTQEVRDKLWSDLGDLQTDASIHLENYCAEYGDGYSSPVPWGTCPECERLFRPYVDYICWRCRSTDA